MPSISASTSAGSEDSQSAHDGGLDDLCQSFGSINLTTPLRADHPAGVPVVVIDPATRVPRINISSGVDAGGVDDNAAFAGVTIGPTTAGSPRSTGSSQVEVKMLGKSKIKIPPIPKRRHEARNFHADLVDRVLQASLRPDEKEKEWKRKWWTITSTTRS